jgi:hypothetical protein
VSQTGRNGKGAANHMRQKNTKRRIANFQYKKDSRFDGPNPSLKLANKPANAAPKVIRAYKDEDGVKMVECEGGRIFNYDQYIKTFVPASKVDSFNLLYFINSPK